ncbi:hypothetical protein HAX54_031800 [Datura stramonium]|uniref:Uncharacterized protein n=1 Tax=Datura stramonium TaxID=4076 RepID=A0ABS8VCK0_DATST|nr:hypothetical protein [Datura stramonium]
MGVAVIDSHFHRSYGNEVCHAFPKLKTLTIIAMHGLKEWSGVENGDFPCLSHLVIRKCPKLVALQWLSYLCSLKNLEITDCKEISSLGNKELPSSLEFLSIRDCPKLKEKYCRPKASGWCSLSRKASDWFQIAHVPYLLIDLEKISTKEEEDLRVNSKLDWLERDMLLKEVHPSPCAAYEDNKGRYTHFVAVLHSETWTDRVPSWRLNIHIAYLVCFNF